MAKSKSPSRLPAKVIAEFDFPVRFRVLEPEFRPLASLKNLDMKRLRTGNHVIELGFLHGGCCPKLVRATVRKGYVTGLDVEPCEGTAPSKSKETRRLFERARRHLKAPGKWKPVAIDRYLPMVMARKPTAGTGAGCFYICSEHYCLFCCWWNFPWFCWIETRLPVAN
jgi:hypothetical protein